jgi:hypothetical protein
MKVTTEAEHAEALVEIERLWDAESGTPEANKRELLAMLVHKYEREREPIEFIDSRSDESWTDPKSYPWYLQVLNWLDFELFRCRWEWFCLWVDGLLSRHRSKR